LALRVYNTLTRRKEEFTPKEPRKISIYVCGVTPYNFAHIGNARPPVVWDCIRRFLEFTGYKVTLIQNFTDVDDKIINRAKELGREPLELSKEYSRVYLEDIEALGVRLANKYPKVSEHIVEIIQMVETLEKNGHAYSVDGDVYFSIDTFPDYGKLSGRTLEEMQAGARVEIDERKKHPMDFALWKAAKTGEPSWDSPWGQGRPGWHIECSAMSLKYLGNCFDFHGGGTDLIFPHHENEIAQSEAYTGCAPFVRYWLHSAFITLGGDKMSKSLGNVATIREVLEHFPAKVVRFWLIGTQYRNPLSFGEDELNSAAKGLERLETARTNLTHCMSLAPIDGDDPQAREIAKMAVDAKTKFVEAMEDDFNTALALGALYELVRESNRWAMGREFRPTVPGLRAIEAVICTLNELGDILGIWFSDKAHDGEGEINDREVEELIAKRQEARKNKDWKQADVIRDQLKAAGIVLEDTVQGVRWRRG
jgi:cysteinyl-tRNA synthetase